MTLKGRIYHHLSCLVQPPNSSRYILLVNIRDTEYTINGDICCSALPTLCPALLQHIIMMLLEVNSYCNRFFPLLVKLSHWKTNWTAAIWYYGRTSNLLTDSIVIVKAHRAQVYMHSYQKPRISFWLADLSNFTGVVSQMTAVPQCLTPYESPIVNITIWNIYAHSSGYRWLTSLVWDTKQLFATVTKCSSVPTNVLHIKTFQRPKQVYENLQSKTPILTLFNLPLL